MSTHGILSGRDLGVLIPRAAVYRQIQGGTFAHLTSLAHPSDGGRAEITSETIQGKPAGMVRRCSTIVHPLARR